MPKIPRDLSGIELAELLQKFGYLITRQSGSHIRLTSSFSGRTHHITIPSHSPIKIGTLNKILKEIADYLKIDKQSLIKELFEK
ncbi:MAG: type II toxin-antitoxin system HicA family toxin [Thermodesulfovibrio sp.]|nr:type II toxin-antitoxin system HicA family toxin [Thermodesulfovibrio sp.]